MGGSKKTTQDQTFNQTQTAAPPEWTMPGIDIASKAVTDALATATANPTPYTGDFVSGYDPAKLAQTQQALSQAGSGIGNTQNFLDQQTKALFQERDLSTELQAAINSAIHPVFRQLEEQTLPGLRDSAISAGAYTNSRALGVVPQMAIREATENAQRLAATLGYQGLQAEEDRRIQRAGLLPSLSTTSANLGSQRASLAQQGMTIDQAASQALLDNQLAKHNYSTTAPYEDIAPAVALLQQLSGNYGTQTSEGQSKSTTVEKNTGLGPILQGVMGLAMGAGSLGAFGNLGGASAGASAGGVLPQLPILPTASAYPFSQNA